MNKEILHARLETLLGGLYGPITTEEIKDGYDVLLPAQQSFSKRTLASIRSGQIKSVDEIVLHHMARRIDTNLLPHTILSRWVGQYETITPETIMQEGIDISRLLENPEYEEQAVQGLKQKVQEGEATYKAISQLLTEITAITEEYTITWNFQERKITGRHDRSGIWPIEVEENDGTKKEIYTMPLEELKTLKSYVETAKKAA